MPDATRKLQVFLCHSSNDKPAVRELHRRLVADGVKPWLDEEDLLPGQEWDPEIRKAGRQSDLILVCLSRGSINKAGYIQKEIKFVLDVADEQPPGTMFVIPLRLEQCDVPERLSKWHWDDYYDERGYARLMRALRARAETVGARLDVASTAQSPIPNSQSLILESPIHLELVRVPAGEFLMGSDGSKDKDAWDDEKPQHRVKLPEYAIGKYPVTVAQFSVFVQATGHRTTAELEGSSWIWGGKEWKSTKGVDWRHPQGPKSNVSQKDDHPVTHVSWHDAVAFCEWLRRETGRAFGLPSEAEWEKAARGADGRIYPWGSGDLGKSRCNFNMHIGDTTPVGHYSPEGDSPYGCVDVAGNVWEWTRSLWGENAETPDFGYPYTDRLAVRENLSAGNDVRRVLRGGSFVSGLRRVRCACRSAYRPDSPLDVGGFRVLASPNYWSLRSGL